LVAGFVLTCLVTRRCRIPMRSGLPLVLVGALYAVSPTSFKGTFSFDMRFAIMLAFLIFGGLMPTRLPRFAVCVLAAVLAGLFMTRMTVLAATWHGHQRDLRDLRAVTAPVEAGARVLVATVSPQEAPGYWEHGPLSRRLSTGIPLDAHLPALLLIEHHAYWPFLFDNPSQQPIETLQPYRGLAERIGAMPDHHMLDVPGKIDLCGYDYVLLLEAGGEPDLAHFAANRLRLLAQSDVAALFHVRPAACALSQ
jgi:hypothetical protein